MRAVIIDWGGVLTQPIAEAVRDWIAADKIDWDSYLAAVDPWLTDAYNTAYSTANHVGDHAEGCDADVNPSTSSNAANAAWPGSSDNSPDAWCGPTAAR